MFLAAGRPVPDHDYYDDWPLTENGVGSVRQFLSDAEAILADPPTLAGRRIAIVTGTRMGEVMAAAACAAGVGHGRGDRADRRGEPALRAHGDHRGAAGGRRHAGRPGRRGPFDGVLIPAETLNDDQVFIDSLPFDGAGIAVGAPGGTRVRAFGRAGRAVSRPLPSVAVVGRPNVGKSTLFNRVVGKRLAIVEDTPGVTRDRNFARGSGPGREFYIVDTGGLEPDVDEPMAAAIRRQVEAALAEAEVIAFVVDTKAGVQPLDLKIADILRKTGSRWCWWSTRWTTCPRTWATWTSGSWVSGEPQPRERAVGEGLG
jgi:small GTP-binding protein